MLSAFQLLRHAINLLTRRPWQTIKVVAPGLILMLGVTGLTVMLAPDLLTPSATNPQITEWSGGIMQVTLIAAFVLSYALMAVLWHRYTLSGDRAPRPMGPLLMLRYLWRVGLLTLIQLAASLVLVLPLTLSAQASAPDIDGPAMPSILLTTFITQLVLVWLSLRLSLILPAAALGRPITLLKSWQLTTRMTRALWGVATVLALINTVLTAVINLMAPPTPERMLAIELPIYVAEGLLIFSVLTALYAHLIQKRRVFGL